MKLSKVKKKKGKGITDVRNPVAQARPFFGKISILYDSRETRVLQTTGILAERLKGKVSLNYFFNTFSTSFAHTSYPLYAKCTPSSERYPFFGCPFESINVL
jgi:hypothetical protein